MIGCFICRPSPRQCPQPKIRGAPACAMSRLIGRGWLALYIAPSQHHVEGSSAETRQGTGGTPLPVRPCLVVLTLPIAPTGMLVVFSLIAAVVGLTGASSLARCLSTVLGEPKASARPSKDRQVQKRATPPAGRALQRIDSPALPRSLSSKASLVNSLLDDAEIQLHVIARQQPGAERRCAPCFRPL